MDGWADRRMGEKMEERMDGWMMDGQMDGWSRFGQAEVTEADSFSILFSDPQYFSVMLYVIVMTFIF